MTFKAGDKIKIRIACSGTLVGEIYEVDGDQELVSTAPGQQGGCSCPQYWDLVTDIKIINMNLIEKAKLAFKGEPEKTFIKAGVMDSNENLTADGQALFLTYLLKKNGDDFKTTVIDPILADEEAK